MPHKFTSNGKFALSKSLKIGVLSGGNSSERKISLRSGKAVHDALKRIGFSILAMDPLRFDEMEKKLSRVDLVFLALHGRGGEDGSMQRYLDKRRMPYTGSDSRASLKAFDKLSAKKLFVRDNIPTPPFVLIDRLNWRKKLSRFSPPYFVKPLRDGSSVGVFLVEDLEKSVEKIKQALKEYQQLIAERQIAGREFTVGVLGSKALPVIELIPNRLFYDYRAKYTAGMTQYIVPPCIAGELENKLRKIALDVHRSLHLRDFCRVDIMVDKEDNPFVLEANSIPGMTSLSLLPKAAFAAGISFEELCYKLIELSYRRNLSIRKKSGAGINGKKEK